MDKKKNRPFKIEKKIKSCHGPLFSILRKTVFLQSRKNGQKYFSYMIDKNIHSGGFLYYETVTYKKSIFSFFKNFMLCRTTG